MELIIEEVNPLINLAAIHPGTVMHVRHRDWMAGKTGIVWKVTESKITLHYTGSTGIGVFEIPAREIAAGLWQIRWSEDLVAVYEYPGE